MAWFLSAERGADHVHGELKSQNHQVDDSNCENYPNAAQSFDLRLGLITRFDPARVRPSSAPGSSTPTRIGRSRVPATRPESFLRGPLCSPQHTHAGRASRAPLSRPQDPSCLSLNRSLAISA